MENTATAKAARLTIENRGDYVGCLYIGSEKTPCYVVLDTGSSTLAVSKDAYNPYNDNDAKSTGLLQVAQYGSGSWEGVVFTTNVNLQDADNDFNLNGVNVAVAFQAKNMFRSSDGILGLAYQELNTGIYKLVATSQGKEAVPTQETLKPYFTQLEEAGIVANKFAFYTLRSTPSVADSSLNTGYLILGGGEEEKDLFEGEFQSVTVTHDQYYNVNLKSISVGDQPALAVPAATSGDAPNCIVDSGTNGLVFPQAVYHQVIQQFSNIDSNLGDIISSAMQNGSQYDQSQLDLANWPAINVVLEGPSGDVTLSIAPDTYWQLDSGQGVATLRFFGASNPAILGLPFMNNYYSVFDRSVDGNGVIKFATIKK
jgi:hypothetical protein